MNITKLVLGIGLAISLTACGTQKVTTQVSKPNFITTEKAVAKKTPLTEEQLKGWPHMDIIKDSVPGMSLDRAYDLLKGKTPTTVIVAVNDSGIDIEHEDLNYAVWTNSKEVPGNGIDDDKNGYIDDIHGWNFLSGEPGKDCPEQLEMTRIVAKLMPKYDGKTVDQVSDKEEFAYYTKLKEEVDAEYQDAKGQLEFYKGLQKSLIDANNAIKAKLGKSDYTIDEIMNLDLGEESANMGKGMLIRIMAQGATGDEAVEELQGAVDHFVGQAEYNYNLNFKGRQSNDNPYDINDRNYGNGNIIGSKDTETHGSHVAGIILAQRNNGVGMNGVTNNAKLMVVRCVPDGDEYDKDVALGIRYAVDNGAKVINMSFGKSYSSNPEWVYDAIKYAESKDVLLVHAAGNDGANIDMENNFPNDSKDKIKEISDNVLTVGAMTYNFDEKLPATFSNYGKLNVDIFAPGFAVYSTTPKNTYDSYPGTSMASPQVAGVAALIRAYYPQLTASQVKHIIMDSGIDFSGMVNVPSEDRKSKKKDNFSSLSVSGKVLNAYNALLLAEQVSKGK